MNAVVCRVADDLPLSITSSSVRETDDSGEFVPLFASSIPSGEPPSSWTLRPVPLSIGDELIFRKIKRSTT